MKYRKFGRLDVQVSALGFGCMRLPILGDDAGRIDEPEAIRMIRHAVDRGVNYIDTAYPYHQGQSERLVAKALKDGYREKVYLATKFPSWMLREHADFYRLLDEQLQKLETGRIDFYLLHALNKAHWETMLRCGVFEAIKEYLKSGKVGHIGFSFHDDLETFKTIIDAYDWDFCQIQYNYLDEHRQAGLEGLRYAAARGIAVIVMEPLLGGKLATEPPRQVADIWAGSGVKRTPAEWALRWVWNHPEVSVVLSGMSTFGQVEENLRIADEALPDSLSADEMEAVERVKQAYNAMPKIDCTGCEYCMPCPYGVQIPRNLRMYNALMMFNDLKQKGEYLKLDESARASGCQACRNCEKACPQKLKISELMPRVVEALTQ
jgi:predicted aldo/keto reductase-like oxidoreductase